MGSNCIQNTQVGHGMELQKAEIYIVLNLKINY